MASQPPRLNTDQGLASFSPPLDTLSYLSTSIQIAIQVYENAQSPSEKAAALQRIQTASMRLSRAVTPLPAQLMQLNFGPNLNVAVRVAIEMGLFESLPASGDAILLAELAVATKSEQEFLLRIARVLVAFDVLLSPEQGAYAHTPMSRLLLLPPVKASTTHLFDNMLAAQTHSAGSYYTSHGFKSPEDPRNSPFSFANGAMGMGIFDILEKEPGRMNVFNSAMTMTAMFGVSQIAGLYPFEKLEVNGEGVRLVDVGGGKGHILREILKVHPGMKGSVVLEDMSVVLEGGAVVGEGEGVMLQSYDFLKEVQPIVGASYFLKSIFHDWPDSSCLQIMANLAPAMRGHPNSRLLICDLVLSDQHPDAGKVLRDINMLCIGGKERSLKQWASLLSKGGFKTVKVWGEEGDFSQIIEAVLDETVGIEGL